MVTVMTPTFDLNGYLALYETEASDVFAKTRRTSRIATLDGGVSLSDLGFTHGDRTLRIVAKATIQQAERLSYLFENYSTLFIATVDGLFAGVIQSVRIVRGKLSFVFLVESKITEV